MLLNNPSGVPLNLVSLGCSSEDQGAGRGIRQIVGTARRMVDYLFASAASNATFQRQELRAQPGEV